MTSYDERANAKAAWEQWHIIESKPRSSDKWQVCGDHPLSWDWQNYQYRDAGPSPVHLLFAELVQACADGEAVILSQHNAKDIVSYLDTQRK